MKAAVFLTARLGSTRLPQKALLDVAGKPALQHLIDRVNATREPDLRVLCTTTLPEDQALADLASRAGLAVFRGDPKIVVRRYLATAEEHGVDFFVTAEGDDLFTDPEHMDRTIRRFRETSADLVMCKQLPFGASCYGVRVAALREVESARDPGYAGSFVPLFVDSGRYRVEEIAIDDPTLRRPEIRMSMDYPEDLAFFRAVCTQLGATPSLSEILRFLDANPAVRALNQGVEERYWANYRRESGRSTEER